MHFFQVHDYMVRELLYKFISSILPISSTAEDAVDHDEEVVRCVGGDGVAPDVDAAGDGLLGAHRRRAVGATAHGSGSVSVGGEGKGHRGAPGVSWKTGTWEASRRRVERASAAAEDGF